MAYVSWSVVFGEQPSAAKWNILGANDASFNDGTGIGAVLTNGNLSTTAGALGGAWTTWSPTWSTLTVGNGTVTGRYLQVGKTVFYRLSAVWGGTTSLAAGTDTFTLPVTAATYPGTAATVSIGNTIYYDTSATEWYYGFVFWASTTTADFSQYMLASTTAVTADGLNATTPATWATGDQFNFSGSYEAA